MTKAILVIFTLILVLTTSGREALKQKTTDIKEGTIINLYDAFGKDVGLTKDFGFSCITKYNGNTILFDAGTNADIFRINTSVLGIDLTKVDIVVVSHGHPDHLNGIDYLLSVNPDVKIYFPYDLFWGAPVHFDATGQEPKVKDSLPEYMQYFDGKNSKFLINQSGRFWNANIEFVKTSKEILPGLNLITTNSEYMGYFSCYPNKSVVEGEFEDTDSECRKINLPELSLSIKTDKGQVLITGCSHSGIDRIVKETKTVTNDKIELLYGGLHMIPFNRLQTLRLINILKSDFMVHRVAPAHCTGHLAFKLLQNAFKDDYLFAGLGEIISF